MPCIALGGGGDGAAGYHSEGGDISCGGGEGATWWRRLWRKLSAGSGSLRSH